MALLLKWKSLFREQICIIKIISDNKENAPTNLLKIRGIISIIILKILKSLLSHM